jgi:hypothetical protein
VARAVVVVGEVPGAREGRAPLLPIESGNEEMKLPLTLEIQARAMARTLLRGAGACRQRISPAHRDERHSSVRVLKGATQARAQ